MRKSGIAMVVVGGGVLAGSLGLAGTAHASAVACHTTHTDKTSTTSTGSWSHTIENRRVCGKQFTMNEWRYAHSYTGAYSTTTISESGTVSPSHWTKYLHRVSVSKTGRVTVTDQVTTK